MIPNYALKESDMFETLSDSMKKIARGSAIAIAGLFGGLLLQFISRIFIARYGSEADYGIFSLALVVLNFAMILACLGLQEGATRYIAYFRGRGKGEVTKVRVTVAVSLQLAAAASIIISIALFFSANYIASNIFHSPDLAQALKVFAIGLPFFTLINILVAIFRGFDRVEPQAFFQFVLLNILFLFLLLAIILFGLPFIAVFYAYLISLVVIFIALVAYTFKKLPQPVTFTNRLASSGTFRRELLFFSLPLLGITILTMTVLSMDTLLLGYFKMPEIVGLYNGAYPLAYFISVPIYALFLIYTPVATGLYSQSLMAELKRSYIISTKWIVSLTLPIFLVLCLFPEAVLNLFFGPAYVAAAPALRILSLGFIINNLFGPNQSILLAMGESGFIMWASLAAAMINILLDIVLIPPLDIVGAAIASASSVVITKLIISIKAYLLCQAQPLSKNLLKPIAVSIVLALLLKFATPGLVSITWWMLVLLFILYYAIYAIAVVVTRSFDREDIALLLEIEKMSGVNAAPIKKLLERFIRL